MRKQVPTDGPLIKVTLKELKGIEVKPPHVVCRTEPAFLSSMCEGKIHATPSPRIPTVTAAVAFSGSADDMQVGSNFICSKTGNLVVESQSAVLAPSFRNDEVTAGLYPLVAEWNDIDGSVSPQLSSPYSVVSSSRSKPDLTIRLSPRDSRVPNGGSELHRNGLPSLDESDGSSTSEFVGELDMIPSSRSEPRGASVVWSTSSAHQMPEIVELNVSLIVHGEDRDSMGREGDSQSEYRSVETHLIGVAFVCLFGQDIGTTVMELPVRKHPSLESSSTSDGVGSRFISLSDNASLCIQVDILSPDQEESSPEPGKVTDDMYSESLLRNVESMDPILQQLRLAHSNHRTLLRKSAELRAKAMAGPHELPHPTSSSCLNGLGLMDMLNSMLGAVKRCEEEALGLYRSDSMASTINTAPSLDI